ncbi:MAG TPA: hypothetical protein VGR00_02700 [Thermoanaerobaculia bacterium]|nr:hypothetical protein [Thermoanaerobaculia bacterium]
MSAACPDERSTRELLARRDEDVITAQESRRLSDHLAACESCAEEAVRHDPTLLFASLATSSEESATVVRKSSLHPAALSPDSARVMSDVLAAIEIEQARTKYGPSRRRTALRAASIAFLAASLAGVATYGTRQVMIARRSGAAEPSPVALAPAPAAAVGTAAPAFAAAASRRPLIEGLGNRGATVYQFAGSPSEPSVVFVVDRNADI